VGLGEQAGQEHGGHAPLAGGEFGEATSTQAVEGSVECGQVGAEGECAHAGNHRAGGRGGERKETLNASVTT